MPSTCVNRMEEPVFRGSRQDHRVGLGRGSAVPVKLRLPACASSGPALQARLIAVPSSPTSMNGSVVSLRAVRKKRQLIKTRNFHPLDLRTGNNLLTAEPSHPARPRKAPRGKRVCLSGDFGRTPRPGRAHAVWQDGALSTSGP